VSTESRLLRLRRAVAATIAVQAAVLVAAADPGSARTVYAPHVYISVDIVRVRGADLLASIELPARRAHEKVWIRTTSATSVWEGDDTHGVGHIRSGDHVFARGRWVSAGVFAATYLVVNAVNEYGVVQFVRRASIRLRLLDHDSLGPIVPARYDVVSLNAGTMLNGRPRPNVAEALRAGALVQVIGVRTSPTAVRAVNILRLKEEPRRSGRE
jgi:hypothetical protein